MATEFDASLVWGEPIGGEVLAAQQSNVDELRKRPNALANARLHAGRELERAIMVCNRLAWGAGAMPADRRPPSAAEIEELLGRLGAEDRDKLMREARQAAEQRLLVAAMQEAEQACLAEMQAEQEEIAVHEAERLELEAFEAHDAAGKAARFEAWRAALSR
jgi:hypothetical protein